jgi:hypothetical protein
LHPDFLCRNELLNVTRSGNNSNRNLPGVSKLGIKPAWVLMTFLCGMAVAVITENLILEHRNHRLEFSAPRTDFFDGAPMKRLRNALEVPFIIKTTLWSGNKNHVFASAVDQFVVSYDIWDETPNAYTVVKTFAPTKRASHLSAKEAQAWCLSQMSLDTTGLSGNEPLWARLEIRAEDPLRKGSALGGSVNESGISLLAPLIDLLSRPPGSQPFWQLDYDAFTLDQLQRTRVE